MLIRNFIITASVSCSMLAACLAYAQESQLDPDPRSQHVKPTEGNVRKLETLHVPNLVKLHDQAYSGGLPEGDAAFEELQKLGIKTVISVDGMTPDVATAAKYGLRYIHLPHGYDGVPDSRVLEIAKAVKESDGPVFIHCHHGKHRSPAAAAAACVANGLITPDEASQTLAVAGTNVNYRGLFRSVNKATRVEEDVLRSLQVEFHEVEPLPPMAEAMVKMEHAFDGMNKFSQRDWQIDPDHPDATAAHEALLLRELYTELLRADYVKAESEGFQKMLAEGEAIAKSVEDELHRLEASTQLDSMSLKSKLGKLQSNCKACHEAYRDNR